MADADASGGEAGASKKRPAEEQLTREAVAAETKSEAVPAPAAVAPAAAAAVPSIASASGASPFSAFAAAAAGGGVFGSALAGGGGGFGGFKAAAAGGASGFGGFGAPPAGDGFPAPAAAAGRAGAAFGGAASAALGAAEAAEEGDADGDDDDAEAPPLNADFKPVCTLPEAPRVTGEEDESNLFSAQATLFAFEAPSAAPPSSVDAPAAPPAAATWRERGRGEVRCNARAAGAGGAAGAPAGARVLMRAAGHLRLLLNAALYPGMVVSVMDGGKGVSFACVNTADAAGASALEKEKEGAACKGGSGMRTFAVRLRGADAEERTVAFKAAIDEALSRLGKAGGEAGGEGNETAATGEEAV